MNSKPLEHIFITPEIRFVCQKNRTSPLLRSTYIIEGMYFHFLHRKHLKRIKNIQMRARANALR